MFLFNNIYKNKNKNSIITEKNEVISYKNLLKSVDEFSKNIKKRCLVFLLCQNNLETIVGYLGFIRSDCVVSLIDEGINPELLESLISKYEPDYIFLPQKKTKFIKHFSLLYSYTNYELLEKKNKRYFKLNDDLMLLISTSGSTGSSKYVRQSYINVQSNTESISKYLCISDKDVAITTLPMSYVYGLSIINTHLSKGGCLVLNNKSVLEKSFWNVLQQNKVTNFGGVPYTYSILDKINLNNYNLKSLKYTTQAGGKLNLNITKKIIRKYEKLKIKLFVMYGAAEATARMSYLPWKDLKNKIGSIGKPIPGGKFYIIDKNNKKINVPNKSGELAYKGKNVCMGYARNINDLSKDDQNNGFLKTGDIGYQDKDNFYYLIGRKDRYIKIYGMRINLDELEEIILKFGSESMCIGEKENKISIFVTNNKKINELKKYLVTLTNLHPSTFLIKVIDKFPLNKNLKKSYQKELLK